MEDLTSADTHAAACGYALKEAAVSGKPMPEQVPGRSYKPQRGTHIGAGFLAETVASRGTTLEQPVPEGLYPMEKIHTGESLEGLYPMGRAPHWSREQVDGG